MATRAMQRIGRFVARRNLRHERAEEILDLTKRGAPRDEVAAKLGVSPSFVSWTTRRAGMGDRRRKPAKTRSTYRDRSQKAPAKVRTTSRRLR